MANIILTFIDNRKKCYICKIPFTKNHNFFKICQMCTRDCCQNCTGQETESCCLIENCYYCKRGYCFYSRKYYFCKICDIKNYNK